MVKKKENQATKKERIARFRETARAIVKDDRFKRKHGLSVDTGGAITRALEKAFQQGLNATQENLMKTASTGPSNVTSIPWITIPPRPRDAFWRICLSFLGTDMDTNKEEYFLEPAMTNKGAYGWTTADWNKGGNDVISDRSIQPLLRLELLKYKDESQNCVQLTQLGQSTWEKFCDLGGRYPDDNITW